MKLLATVQTVEGTNLGSMDIVNVDSGTLSVPLDAIQSVANMEPLSKPEHYYTGLAWIMMKAVEEAYLQRAIEHFKIALDLSPGG